jgi:hypothetical protein
MPKAVAGHPQWRGQRDARARVFGALVALSVLLHAPLTPIGALFGLLSLLDRGTRETPDLGEIEGIPVTLLSADELAALGLDAPAEPPKAPDPGAAAESPLPEEAPDELFAEPVAPPPPKPEPPKPRPKPVPEKPVEPVDGGVPEGSREPEGRPAEPTERLPEAPDGGPRRPGTEKAPPGPAPADPGSLVGAVASVTDPNANVKLLLLNDKIAQHPAGPRIGALLKRVPQWRSFFGPAGLDPIKDIRRVYIAGPQFRQSSDVVAVLEYSVPEPAMRAAVDAIVRREPRGEWLDTKLPAARARADRAERTFVFARPGVVAMVPPRLTDDTLSKASGLKFPPVGGDAAVVAFVNTPWRVLLGLETPVTIPKSIASLMIQVLPAPGGGVEVRLRAQDASEQEAREHASVLERAINFMTQRDMGALGSLLFGSEKLQLLEPVTLKAEGKAIVGSARATPRQLDRMLNFLESWLDAQENRERLDERRRAPAPEPAPGAPRRPPGQAPPPAKPAPTKERSGEPDAPSRERAPSSEPAPAPPPPSPTPEPAPALPPPPPPAPTPPP